MTLGERIRQLEEAAPRLYSRWSPRAWRLVCEGPAVTLWDGLSATEEGETTLTEYLYLLREAVGLQYVSASAPEDLLPGVPGRGFLAVALCEVLPRLLPALPAADRARVLAQVWNTGEKLVAQPVWLNRYLAIRLCELESLVSFEDFLGRVLREGLDPVPLTTWAAPFRTLTVDLSGADRAFLPGRMHMATPSIACVHDRRREGRHVALLLRRGAGTVVLGATPCLASATSGSERCAAGSGLGEPPAAAVPPPPSLEFPFGPVFTQLASPSGFLMASAEYSQRLWLVEAAAA